MENEKIEVSVPVICTRGIVVFPNQDIMIEVGRDKSVNAVEESNTYFNGHVWLVSQRDILVDEPHENDLYTFGTLCRVKTIKRKEGFMRVTFTGLQRAKLVRMSEDDRMFLRRYCR
jgi:ATP-dependent Lon protease